MRTRYTREIELRRDDPAYRRVAKAAELISRPLRPSPRRHTVDVPLNRGNCVYACTSCSAITPKSV